MKQKTPKKPHLTIFGWINLIYIFIIVFCVGFIVALEITHNLPKLFPEWLNPPKNTTLQVNTTCSNLDLVNTSYCLNKEIQTFYKYNLSNIGKAISDEQLKAEGGVCSNYANYYANHLKLLNSSFNVETPLLRVNQTDNHIVALVSDESGYCLLDQTIIGCLYFKVNSSE